ncbi:hypothetical protein, partial [Streptosporangium carneum]|uniref:hypothetical protein n=1 Tax=Streptosporangium carneum TaxID=47481 RepID=UPI0022F32F6D
MKFKLKRQITFVPEQLVAAVSNNLKLRRWRKICAAGRKTRLVSHGSGPYHTGQPSKESSCRTI